MKHQPFRSFLCISTLPVSVTLSGCTDPYADAKDTLARRSTDPSRVQFEDVHAGGEGTVCGRVNLPNSQGGMTGFQAFVWYPGDQIALSVPYARMSERADRPLSDRVAADQLTRLFEEAGEFDQEHGRHCSWEQFE